MTTPRSSSWRTRARCALGLAALLAACSPYKVMSSKGGGQIPEQAAEKPRRPHAFDIEVPDGYRIELVARGLTFPTGVAFDDAGKIYVAESGYSVGDANAKPRLVEIDADGKGIVREVATGDHAPWNGVTWAGGAFFIAEGGNQDGGGGRIARIDADGKQAVLVDALPSLGDHHTDAPLVVGDWVYFGQGTATNSGVVGEDSRQMGWLDAHPDFHDTPCKDVTLVGTNFKTGDTETGAYLPFGTRSEPGQVIAGRLPCSGAVMRVPSHGGNVELVAWGFRNPYGMAAAPDGTIYVTDNGYDVRGSRPVFGAADVLWKLEDGAWYGWPDYSEGRPLTDDAFGVAEGDTHGFVLADHPGTPPAPVANLPVHGSADGLDISRSDAFGHTGWAFVALFGDMAPVVGKVLSPVGFSVVRVDPATGRIEDFARNAGGGSGPASRLGTDGFERPIAARFDPSGDALYVVDFGVLRMTDDGPDPEPGTGALWRITREEAPHAHR